MPDDPLPLLLNRALAQLAKAIRLFVNGTRGAITRCHTCTWFSRQQRIAAHDITQDEKCGRAEYALPLRRKTSTGWRPIRPRFQEEQSPLSEGSTLLFGELEAEVCPTADSH